MIKHICDLCNSELKLNGDDYVRFRLNVSGRGLPRCERNLECQRDCFEKLFGEEFTAGIIAEDNDRKQRIAERKAAMEKKKQEYRRRRKNSGL